MLPDFDNTPGTSEGESAPPFGPGSLFTHPRVSRVLPLLLMREDRRPLPKEDILNRTYLWLLGCGQILAGLDLDVRAAELGRVSSYYLSAVVLRFRFHRHKLESFRTVGSQALDELASTRFRHGLGTARGYCGAASTVALVLLAAFEDIDDLLDIFHELDALLESVLQELPPELAEVLFAKDPTAFLHRLDAERARSAELNRAFEAVPSADLRDLLRRYFTQVKVDELIAQLHQEYCQAVADRASAAPARLPLPSLPHPQAADGAEPAGMAGQAAAKLGEPAAGDEPRPDGPQPPNWLWWKGARHRIGAGGSLRPWQLLNAMWGREVATFEELQGPGTPWPDPVSPSTFSTTAGRVNLALPAGFPRRLVTRGNCVLWEPSQGNHGA